MRGDAVMATACVRTVGDCRWPPCPARRPGRRAPPRAAAGSLAASAAANAPGIIRAVGAENQYAALSARLAGSTCSHRDDVQPDTDPHTFEASPAVAREVTRPAHCAERPWLRRVHGHHREGRARLRAHVIACSSCCSFRTPPPTRTCGTTRRRCRRWPTRSPPPWRGSSPNTRPTQGQRASRTAAQPLDAAITASRRPTRAPRSRHRAGRRLPADRPSARGTRRRGRSRPTS